MLTIEKKFCDWFENNRHILFFIAISILGAGMRYFGRGFISDDMEKYLIPWFNIIKDNGGLSGLSKQVGNYNILYQTIIALFTYLDIYCVYQYKILSIVFDYVLAFSCAYTLCEITNKKIFDFTFNLFYTIVLCLPTVVLNSAYWGQCDSIYASFVVLTILFLYKEKYVPGFIFLGIAFAFKFQTIFIFPFIFCYYFYKKDFSISLFIISLCVFMLLNSTGFIYGRSILEPFKIYFGQTADHPYMWLNFPSFWMLIGYSYANLSKFAFLLTIVLLGLGLYVVLSNKKELNTPEQFLNTFCWFFWTCVLFLPCIHERYSYILDIFLICLCFFDKKYIKYAVLSIVLGFITYGKYLFGIEPISIFHALIYVIGWIHFSYFILNTSNLSINTKKT